MRKLNNHIATRMRCPCGLENQTADHVLQRHPGYYMLRKTRWLVEIPQQTKLSLPPSAGTGEDRVIHRADGTVLVIS